MNLLHELPGDIPAPEPRTEGRNILADAPSLGAKLPPLLGGVNLEPATGHDGAGFGASIAHPPQVPFSDCGEREMTNRSLGMFGLGTLLGLIVGYSAWWVSMGYGVICRPF